MPSRSVLLALPLLFADACWGGCGAEYQDPVSLPAEGTTTPARVPLDVAWETELVVYSGGSPAPMGVPEATATCVPATACNAHVVQPFVENDDPKLVVTPLAVGPAKVKLHYLHPRRKEWLDAELSFEFQPAETMTTVDIGDALPAPPFVLAHVPADFENRTSAGGPAKAMVPGPTSARCESSHVKPSLTCFPLEDPGDGVRRYSSCDSSSRCSVMPGGVLVDGFEICVSADKRIVACGDASTL